MLINIQEATQWNRNLAPARVLSVANLDGKYANGKSDDGVGATLIANTALQLLVVDGVTLFEGDRILLTAQSDARQNGVYDVVANGDGGFLGDYWFLIRASDFQIANQVRPGCFFTVTEGTIGAGALWTIVAPEVQKVGYDVITIVAVANSGPIADALLRPNNLSDLPSVPTARNNLGLGTAALKTASDASQISVASVIPPFAVDTIAAFADSNGTIKASTHAVGDFLTKANNLSDVASVPISRTNLGLGTAAVKAASSNAQSTVASVVGTTVTNNVLTAADGVGSLKDSGVAISSITPITTMTNGQLIIGSTGLPPVANTLTAGSNIAITNAAGSITIATTGFISQPWTVVTGTSQAMLGNNGYIANNAALVTLTLPATSVIGDRVDIVGKGAGGWKAQCGAGQTIVLGSSTTSVAGSLASTNAKDSLYMICTAANTEWTVATGPQGNITVT
jgi:hypothetical protein